MMAKSSGGGGRAGRRSSGGGGSSSDSMVASINAQLRAARSSLTPADKGTLAAIQRGGLSGPGSARLPHPSILNNPGFRFSSEQLDLARSVRRLEAAGIVTVGKPVSGNAIVRLAQRGNR